MAKTTITIDFANFAETSAKITDIVDVNRSSWSQFGQAPLLSIKPAILSSRALEQPYAREFLHLSVVAAFLNVNPEIAAMVYLENPYVQYFCGNEYLQHRIDWKPEELASFISKISQKGTRPPREIFGFLRLLVREKNRLKSGKRRPLEDVLSQHHPLVATAKMFDWRAISGAKPKAMDKIAFRLSILGGILRIRDPGNLLNAILENIYWQYFSGFDRALTVLPGHLSQFESQYAKLLESEIWQQAVWTVRQKYNEISEWLSQFENEGLGLLVHQDLGARIRDLSSADLPLEVVIKGLQRADDWVDIAESFKKKQWYTALIAENSRLAEQRNLSGPRFQLIRSSDAKDAEAVLKGQGRFRDVVVQSPKKNEPGRVWLMSGGPTKPVTRLEAALFGIKSLDQFLNSPEALNRYYDVLATVHPDRRFPRKSYDAILEQVREMVKEIPEIKERLWKKNPQPPHSFTFEVDLPSYGRGFLREKFEAYIPEFVNSIAGQVLTEQMSREEIKSRILRVNQIVRQVEREVPRSNYHERERRFAVLRSDPQTRITLGQIFKNYFSSGSFRGFVELGDTNRLLGNFEILKLNPGAILGDQGFIETTGFWISEVRSALPIPMEIIEKSDAFPPLKGTRGKFTHERVYFELVSGERRLHGIWRGVPWNDCIGGHPEHLDQLMPERWGSILLDNSRVYYVTRMGHLQGSCTFIPFRYGEQMYVSMDTQWQRFFTQKTRGKLVIEAWLEEIKDRLPAGCKGIAVGRHPAGRDPFEISVLQGLRCYKEGRTLGEPDGVEFPDPIAAKIVRFSEARGYGSRFRWPYGSRILTDASIQGTHRLVVLSLDALGD